MRTFDTATLAALQNRTEVSVRILVWVTARNRMNGETASLGMWNGAYDRTFTIGGVSRTYVGAGALMSVSPLTYEVGLTVRMHRLTLSPIDTTVATLIRGYDCRLAPVEIHRAVFDPMTTLLVSEPHRLFNGIVDEVEVPVSATGETRAEMTVAGSARYLTRTLTLKRSDASQQRRQGDRFLRFADVSGEVDVYWGERRASASGGVLG